MKIISYELFQVPPRWLFLKIETDTGFIGWGEPVLEGRAATVKVAVDELMEMLIGKNPLHIEDHWNTMYRGGFYRGGPVLMSAISGIDQALWDIKGKYYNAPIFDLIGGKTRDTIQVYKGINGDTPEELRKEARELAKSGYSSLKMGNSPQFQMIDSYARVDKLIAGVEAVRAELGPSFGIAIDLHGRVSKGMAKHVVKALEPYRMMFIEEPVLPENIEALRDIVKHTSVPIATGERMFSRWDFKDLLAKGYVDIIQPDVSHAGGITECRKILSMAEAYDIAGALHCPLGPIALAACFQLDACCYNAFIQEQVIGVHYNVNNNMMDYLNDKEVFSFKDGYVDIPNGPGLGIEIDEEKVREMAKIGHSWRNPVWRHTDGSVAEW